MRHSVKVGFHLPMEGQRLLRAWAAQVGGLWSWPSCPSACQGHQAYIRSDTGSMQQPCQLWERVGEATIEMAQKQVAGCQLLPLSSTDISTGPRWPGSPGLPRCRPIVATVTTTNRGSQATTGKSQQARQPRLAGPPAQAGTAPGICVSLARTSLPKVPQAGNKEFSQ